MHKPDEVLVGAWMHEEVRNQLRALSQVRQRSLSEELRAAVQSHLTRGSKYYPSIRLTHGAR